MFSKLIIATGNNNKYREFKQIISETAGNNFADEIIFAPELAHMTVNETGHSYSENSMLKATAWTQRSGLPWLADDRGLNVHFFLRLFHLFCHFLHLPPLGVPIIIPCFSNDCVAALLKTLVRGRA